MGERKFLRRLSVIFLFSCLIAFSLFVGSPLSAARGPEEEMRKNILSCARALTRTVASHRSGEIFIPDFDPQTGAGGVDDSAMFILNAGWTSGQFNILTDTIFVYTPHTNYKIQVFKKNRVPRTQSSDLVGIDVQNITVNISEEKNIETCLTVDVGLLANRSVTANCKDPKAKDFLKPSAVSFGPWIGMDVLFGKLALQITRLESELQDSRQSDDDRTFKSIVRMLKSSLSPCNASLESEPDNRLLKKDHFERFKKAWLRLKDGLSLDDLARTDRPANAGKQKGADSVRK
jgi:hypothetical protein